MLAPVFNHQCVLIGHYQSLALEHGHFKGGQTFQAVLDTHGKVEDYITDKSADWKKPWVLEMVEFSCLSVHRHNAAEGDFASKYYHGWVLFTDAKLELLARLNGFTPIVERTYDQGA
jgi:hypothetical protein